MPERTIKNIPGTLLLSLNKSFVVGECVSIVMIAEVCDVTVLSCFQSCNASKIITDVRVSMISVVVTLVSVVRVMNPSSLVTSHHLHL